MTAQTRGDPTWYTPAALPDELLALDRPIIGGLQVGAPGKVGLLELAFEQCGGTTRVVRHYQRAPLHVYRPIHLDSNLPEMAFIFVQQFGDGFVDGDRCRLGTFCLPCCGGARFLHVGGWIVWYPKTQLPLCPF